MKPASELVVVAGEASGDALGAEVLATLKTPSFGLGGPRLARAGMDVLSPVTRAASMGIAPLFRRAPRVIGACIALARAIEKRHPRAALLVGFSEVNARVARWLHGRGVRVLWYAPPQAWAWRRGRAPRIARDCEQLAVLLPFEAAFWAQNGARVDYVGHPAAERAISAVPTRREIALLPGSRAEEVRAHLPALLGAALLLARRKYAARLHLAEGLDDVTSAWARASARASGVPFTTDGVDGIAGAAAAVVSSGTATLECAALGVPPVVVYRTDPLTFAVASRLVRVPHVALPNLVLGERAFPELLQDDVTSERIVDALGPILGAGEAYGERCRAVRDAIRRPLDGRRAAERVAARIRPWLE